MHHIIVKENFENKRSYSPNGGRTVRKIIKKRMVSRKRTHVVESGFVMLRTAPVDGNGQTNWTKIMKPDN